MFWRKNSKNIKELELKLVNAEAEISFLKSQLDPELAKLFFDSSVDTKGLSEKYGILLHNLLSSSIDGKWSVDIEAKYLKEYILLYTSISPSEIHYKIEVENDNPSIEIPSLILFPLVQNAVKNGYNNMEKYPMKVKLKVRGEHLTLEVSNRVNHYLVNQADNVTFNRFESRLFKHFAEDYELIVNSNSNLFKVTLLVNLK